LLLSSELPFAMRWYLVAVRMTISILIPLMLSTLLLAVAQRPVERPVYKTPGNGALQPSDMLLNTAIEIAAANQRLLDEYRVQRTISLVKLCFVIIAVFFIWGHVLLGTATATLASSWHEIESDHVIRC
jgi:hypothetical protein